MGQFSLSLSLSFSKVYLEHYLSKAVWGGRPANRHGKPRYFFSASQTRRVSSVCDHVCVITGYSVKIHISTGLSLDENWQISA